MGCPPARSTTWCAPWAPTAASPSPRCPGVCADLDAEVAAFADRSLADQPFPYVFLDATYCKARVNRRVVSQAVVVDTGVAADGRREVLGFAVGDSEDGAFWTQFLRSLKSPRARWGAAGHRRCPPRCAPSSPNPMPTTSANISRSSRPCSGSGSRSWRPCCARPSRSCWPSPQGHTRLLDDS